jgi:hypothetical protein
MMATTKSDIVASALNKLAVTGFDYEIDPEELKAGVVALEYMMADWDARGIKIGYAFAADPETANISDPVGIPDIAYRAVTYHLAIDLADTYGKAVTQSVNAGASSAMTSLLSAIQFLPTVQYPNRMPRGSGNSLRNNRWMRYYRQTDTLDADNAGPIDTNGQGYLQP